MANIRKKGWSAWHVPERPPSPGRPGPEVDARAVRPLAMWIRASASILSDIGAQQNVGCELYDYAKSQHQCRGRHGQREPYRASDAQRRRPAHGARGGGAIRARRRRSGAGAPGRHPHHHRQFLRRGRRGAQRHRFRG
ncbi:hypothetical protein SDC9_29847 [bioreactor metagenome]|uniref:Uncharacterized protein n=1 Tax=bioreactor metagenome TaxID=1076179 RepID=A0A644UXS6_9ZZZZ